ncbi:uncharacterized protein LOC112508016 [Cynara cardunculus var. scolymus]|uniref:Transmembrane protein n=1 Tax=Cynara cardunculus var. scolymus TaxID=59895 RepID=A0A103YKA2_CYNCS|nr:uncharacterized protein LOC112508016 [Cynara cardunculus var. scolymus]KVI10613.1 hypothetical protein Ccrd_010979 [Cynara cardunculus var. scolymus]
MAAKISISSSSATSLATKLHIPPKPSSFRSICPPRTNPPNHHFKLRAKLGGEDSELGKDGKKKFITKEQEPEQYWQTAGEREGENPMKTPLPYIIIFGMSTPFIILAIAFLNGWIKVPIR